MAGTRFVIRQNILEEVAAVLAKTVDEHGVEQTSIQLNISRTILTELMNQVNKPRHNKMVRLIADLLDCDEVSVVEFAIKGKQKIPANDYYSNRGSFSSEQHDVEDFDDLLTEQADDFDALLNEVAEKVACLFASKKHLKEIVFDHSGLRLVMEHRRKLGNMGHEAFASTAIGGMDTQTIRTAYSSFEKNYHRTYKYVVEPSSASRLLGKLPSARLKKQQQATTALFALASELKALPSALLQTGSELKAQVTQIERTLLEQPKFDRIAEILV